MDTEPQDEELFEKLKQIQEETTLTAESEKPQPSPLHPSAVRTLLVSAKKAIDDALLLLGTRGIESTAAQPVTAQLTGIPPTATSFDSTIEGVFDGQGMVGADGKHYSMSPNYASKSKLVQGDRLKLTIGENGMFLYKQISPIPRRRLMGDLEYDAAARAYSVAAEDSRWRVLTASVTYYKGTPGDSVTIIIPEHDVSAWAAVDHLIRKIQ